MYSKTKAALVRQLALSLTLLSVLIACEDPGSVGGGFVEESEVKIDTIAINNFETEAISPYLGKRNYSAVGNFDDPVFGDMSAFTFFKPSLAKSSQDSIDQTTVLKFQLNIYEETIWGDTTKSGSYSLYRVNNIWKGSSFTNNKEITYGSEVIAQFKDQDADTAGNVLFELGGSWKDDFINFYNSDDSSRADNYRDNEYGLAIVPDADNGKIIYVNMSSSSMMIIRDDTLSRTVLDWAYKVNRSTVSEDADHLYLYNTFDQYIKLNLENFADKIENRNFARAELIFVEDTLALQSSLAVNEIRTRAPALILKLGPVFDKAYTFGSSSETNFQTGIFSGGRYTFGVTNMINDNLFGDTSISEAYIYPYSANGVLGFTSLFAPGTGTNLSPKLVVYTIEKEGEN